jgi:hypothetical protein
VTAGYCGLLEVFPQPVRSLSVFPARDNVGTGKEGAGRIRPNNVSLLAMAYTLGQAAKATGKSKPTISNAIESGRLSASKDAFGRWQIDPAELHRVYPPDLTASNDSEHQSRQTDGINSAEVVRLKATVEGLEKLCRQIEDERDSLRTQLAEANEERRTTLRQLTALLTDQRPEKQEPAPAKRRWRLWGRG